MRRASAKIVGLIQKKIFLITYGYHSHGPDDSFTYSKENVNG